MNNAKQYGFIPNNLRMTVIHVTSYINKNFAGYLENPFLGDIVEFSNLTELLLMVDELANELNCPQRSYDCRSFLPTQHKQITAKPHATPAKKAIATFKICIIFRQNASWQGSCEWMEEKQSANFRSALELVQLMDSVLENQMK